MQKRTLGIFVVAFVAAFAANRDAFCAGPRSNDFTQSNLTLKKDDIEKKRWNPEELPSDWTKQFEKKSFKTDADASREQNKRANMGEGLEAKSLSGNKNDLGGRQYILPQQGEDLSGRKWISPENTTLPRNLDRNLNKEYSGSIDFNQKNLSKINKQYVERMEEIQENTMRELNKFFSRDDFSDGGVPITKAGSQDGAFAPKTDSLLDTLGLTSSSDVGRPTIRLDRSGAFGAFTGRRKASADYDSGSGEVSARSPAMRNIGSGIPSRQQANVPAAASGAARAKQPVDDGKVKIAEKKVDTRNYKGSFFGLPKELQSGEAKIEVKVNR